MYSLPYLIFLFVLLFLSFVERGNIKLCSKKTAIFIAYLVAFIFIGLRGHVMCDFIIYYKYFESIPTLGPLFKSHQFNFYAFEPAFVIYTSFVKSISGNYYIWVALNALIDLIVLFVTFKRYCKSTILPLIFFFVFQGYTIEFNLFRNAKSIDLFLLSIPYLQNRQFLKYAGLNLFGTLFHSSALLYIPFYFILNREFSRWLIWSGIVMSNLLFLFKLPLINSIIGNIQFVQAIGVYDKLLGYTNDGQEFGISFGYVERTLSMLLFCIFYRKLRTTNLVNRIFFNSYWCYYISFLLFYEITVFVERIPLLFIYSYWILYPNLLALQNRYKQLVILVVGLLVISRAVVGFNNRTMTYTNILFTTPDYDSARSMQLEEMDK